MRIPNKKLLKSFRGILCEHCRWRKSAHAAHLFHNGIGGGKELDVKENLVGLCGPCHRDHHDGHSPTLFELLELVSRREGLPVQEIVERIRLLQRLPKGTERPVWA